MSETDVDDDTPDSELTTPVRIGDEIVVGCTRCNDTNRIDAEIDPVENDRRDGWEILLTTIAGTPQIMAANCPKHRTDDEIDALAQKIVAFEDTQEKSLQMVEETLET